MPESSQVTQEGAGTATITTQTQPHSNRVVITVHGIRTYGNWQKALKGLLEQADPGITVNNYNYGYFSSIAFLLPPLRWLVARRFRRFFLEAVKSAPPGATIHVVAHSFGTYLAASALKYLPADRKVDTLIFAGSVLRTSFPWYKLQQSGRLGRVVNECGWDDSVLLLCQFTALMMGMAGRVGFQGMVSDRFVNRFYRCGHGGYFDADGRFMRERWLPLLTGTTAIEPVDNRPELRPWEGVKLTVLNNLQWIKIAAALLVLLLVVWIPVAWWQEAAYMRRVERFAHIARLANASQIPGRDPGHVRELLHLDVPASDGAQSLDRAIGSDAATEIEQSDTALAADDEASFWEWIPGFRDRFREARRARRLHAQANARLAADNKGGRSGQAQALPLFQQAINCYKQVNDHDPAHGSYALCLIDYGLLLESLGHHREAIDQFEQVRDGVFPKDAKGEQPTLPKSLLIDSFCYEAESQQALENWDQAGALLLKALTEAGDDDALVSLASNEYAWLRMKRLEATKARMLFSKARDALENLVDRPGDTFVFKTRLYWVRHGQAMVQRLCGDPDGAYDQYNLLVKELQRELERDLAYSPKQRRDLRDRLINSMERRADVRFFARKPPSYFTAAGLTPASYRDLLTKVESDYQEALDQAGNDDPSTRARLYFKKVITHCLDGIDSSAPSEGEGSEVRPSVRIEFAEANNIVKGLNPELRKELSLYQKIAACCLALHEPARREDYLTVGGVLPEPTGTTRHPPQAVEALRALTVDYAAKCEKLDRDHVEMLLVAMELLLEPGIEPELAKSAQDASRMMAVLGATTKLSMHPELQAYVDRFNSIAAAKLYNWLVARSSVVDPERAPVPTQHAEKVDPRANLLPVDGRIHFLLRLSPTRVLMVTDEAPIHGPVHDPKLAQSRSGVDSVRAGDAALSGQR